MFSPAEEGHGDGRLTITDLTTAATPEPSSFVLLGIGILGILGATRKRLLRA